MNKFFEAARQVGCSGYLMWGIVPESFAGQLMASLKRYSRFLKDAGLVKSQSDGLEKIARAAGFPHWHALHTVVQGLFDAFNNKWPRPDGGREPIDILTPAFPFMVEVSKDRQPTQDQRAGLTKAATQLAIACACPLPPVLDMIAQMNGADTWERLLTRKPEESKVPLYRFRVDGVGNGKFVISRACIALIDQQDELFQGYHSRPKSEQRKFEKQLASVLEERPDFLEGQLAAAEVLRYKPKLQMQRGKIYSDAIRQADDLMPAGFNGEVSWHDVSNRFYHRLLYAAMVWHSYEGHTSEALELALRQLRMNKSDNLGVRMWLPVLLVADGQFTVADKACKQMTHDDDTDAGIELIRAIAHLANGRLRESAESLFLSLFMYPPVRHIISADLKALDDALKDEQSTRTLIPDIEAIMDQLASAAMGLEGLEQLFNQWLTNPAVGAAEADLAREFQANWRQPKGTLHKWDAEVKRQAALLSKAATTA
ncbi:MAG: hypothetical protein EPN79_11930 [Burkholderiaceae bacterium]|nr:MAG: hypothetical protein EPN79_11930 [Burkholderiaceae bacterium]TBR76867.1 MAG: hypothetical protein EPN64_06500 [Burkholderiaceae bacterium]